MTTCSDPYIGRFTSPDSIIPEQSQGTQAWDRYAYANNNSVRYNDPSGHCLMLCTALIGAAAGGIIGGATYALTNQRESFKSSEFWTAVGVGVVAGALVGSGVGIVAAAASTSSAAAAAGATLVETNVIMSTAATTASTYTAAGVATGVAAESYMIENPGKFESAPFVANSGIAGLTAAASSGQSLGTKMIVQGAGGAASYFSTTSPDNFSLTNLGLATGGSALGGAFDSGVSAMAGDFLSPNATAINQIQWTNLSVGQGTLTGFAASFSTLWAQQQAKKENTK